MEIHDELRRSWCRGTSLVEVVLALALVAGAVIVAAAGLHGEARLLRLAEHRNAVARTLEAAVESVRSGLLPPKSGSFAPPVPLDLDKLSIRIEVREGSRKALYVVTAVARWQEGGRMVSQRLESMVWRP